MLDGGGWSTPRPGRFTPRKETRYPLYRRLGGPQGRSGQLQKISPLPGFDPRTVQPVVSRYTDSAIPARERYRGKLHDKTNMQNITNYVLLYMKQYQITLTLQWFGCNAGNCSCSSGAQPALRPGPGLYQGQVGKVATTCWGHDTSSACSHTAIATAAPLRWHTAVKGVATPAIRVLKCHKQHYIPGNTAAGNMEASDWETEEAQSLMHTGIWNTQKTGYVPEQINLKLVPINSRSNILFLCCSSNISSDDTS